MSEGPSDPFAEIARSLEGDPIQERRRLDEYYRALDETAHNRTLTNHDPHEMIQIIIRNDPEFSQLTFTQEPNGRISIKRYGETAGLESYEYEAYEGIDAETFGEGRFNYEQGISGNKKLTKAEATILMVGIIDGALDMLQTERAVAQVIHG